MTKELKTRTYAESFQLVIDLIKDDVSGPFTEHLYKIKNLPEHDRSFVLHFKSKHGGQLLFFERMSDGTSFALKSPNSLIGVGVFLFIWLYVGFFDSF